MGGGNEWRIGGCRALIILSLYRPFNIVLYYTQVMPFYADFLHFLQFIVWSSFRSLFAIVIAPPLLLYTWVFFFCCFSFSLLFLYIYLAGFYLFSLQYINGKVVWYCIYSFLYFFRFLLFFHCFLLDKIKLTFFFSSSFFLDVLLKIIAQLGYQSSTYLPYIFLHFCWFYHVLKFHLFKSRFRVALGKEAGITFFQILPKSLWRTKRK